MTLLVTQDAERYMVDCACNRKAVIPPVVVATSGEGIVPGLGDWVQTNPGLVAGIILVGMGVVMFLGGKRR